MLDVLQIHTLAIGLFRIVLSTCVLQNVINSDKYSMPL